MALRHRKKEVYMSLSYRAKHRLRRSITATVVIICMALTAFMGWMIWVDRYIIYTREGARLDFELSELPHNGDPAAPPTVPEPIKIVQQEANTDNSQTVIEQVSISGYYIKSSDLKEDIPGVIEKLQALPSGTAVLMDMKTIKGSFYYSTTVGTTVSKDIDQEQMSTLLEFLTEHDLYTIARIPAFRDWEYGLNNVPQGLPKKGGNGSLWMDDKNCYWLNPTNEEVLGYLIRIITELKSLGFDEVVFTDFRFPDTEKIKFEGNKSEAISNAALTLVEACATERFFVSFQNGNYDFPLPAGSARLYLEDVAAADIPLVRQQAVTTNPTIQLLFLTEANDTRFNDYCVLRPLSNAILSEVPVE